MGYIDLSTEPELSKQIKRRLACRGFVLEKDSECEVHGPHSKMDYQVYIVSAKKTSDTKRIGYLALYPRKIYHIGSSSDWWKCEPDSLIKTVS